MLRKVLVLQNSLFLAVKLCNCHSNCYLECGIKELHHSECLYYTSARCSAVIPQVMER